MSVAEMLVFGIEGVEKLFVADGVIWVVAVVFAVAGRPLFVAQRHPEAAAVEVVFGQHVASASASSARVARPLAERQILAPDGELRDGGDSIGLLGTAYLVCIITIS